MGSPRRYPRTSLAELRQREVDAAARAHATAIREREAAEELLRLAEARRAEHDAAAAAVREHERAALGQGALSVADLARTHHWEVGAQKHREQAEGAVARAAAKTEAARGRERSSQDSVAARKAASEVVQHDRTRWEHAQKAEVEGKEEEALAEACRSKS